MWEPALVSANAKRTADDPTTIAYLGDLDYGASAVSVPTTNEAGVLQVSPSDGLTSLTTVPPGRPQGGPARYYPTDERSFLRLAPSDLRMAEVLLARARELGARRLAVVYDGQVYARELTAQLVARARRDGPEPVATRSCAATRRECPNWPRTSRPTARTRWSTPAWRAPSPDRSWRPSPAGCRTRRCSSPPACSRSGRA